jgi:hypothetical protein
MAEARAIGIRQRPLFWRYCIALVMLVSISFITSCSNTRLSSGSAMSSRGELLWPWEKHDCNNWAHGHSREKQGLPLSVDPTAWVRKYGFCYTETTWKAWKRQENEVSTKIPTRIHHVIAEVIWGIRADANIMQHYEEPRKHQFLTVIILV